MGSLRRLGEGLSAVLALAAECFSYILGRDLPLQVSELLDGLDAVVEECLTLRILWLLLLEASLQRIRRFYVGIHLEILRHPHLLLTRLEVHATLVILEVALVWECAIGLLHGSM